MDVAPLGESVPIVGCDEAGMTLIAHVKGQLVVNAFDGAGADQIIKRGQAGLAVRPTQEGQVLGMSIGVPGQHIKYLPAEKVLRVNGRVAGGVLEQAVALIEGGPASVLVFFLMSNSQGLTKIFLMQTFDLAPLVAEAIIARHQGVVGLCDGS